MEKMVKERDRMKKVCYSVGLMCFLGATFSFSQLGYAVEEMSEATQQQAIAAGYSETQLQEIQEMPDFSLETISEAEAQSAVAQRATTYAAAVTTTKDQIVSEAKKHLGKPYSWGGKGPNSFDCSGLTRYVYMQVTGKNIGDYTVPQESSGRQISVDQAEPGDLYFWGSKGNTYHVAIAIGNGQYIHAPNENEVVKINSSAYFKPDFAVRVIENNNSSSVGINYNTHVQTYGWGDFVQSGQTSGTVGQAKRLEGIQINLDTASASNIQYRTHVQTYGWQGWSKDGQLSGTTGQAKRLEAIEIKLNGTAEANYDIQYRVHSQTYGWQAWTKNGQPAGTEGLAKRLEAIEIKVVPKNTPLPSGGNTAFIKK